MIFRFDRFEFDDLELVLREHGAPVQVETKALRFLQILLRRHPAMVSQEEIRLLLWPNAHVGPDALRRTVRIARRALSETGDGTIVRTVRGRGYALGVPVETVDAQPEPCDSCGSHDRGAFVGRKDLIATLSTAISTAADGRGRAIALVGEPGIGKTRTAEEFGTLAARAGFQVLWARCQSVEPAPVLWPWATILRTAMRAKSTEQLAVSLSFKLWELLVLVPELRERLPLLVERLEPSIGRSDPKAPRFKLFQSICEFFRRESVRRPTALVFDDLNLADATSVRLFGEMAIELRNQRILLLATYRNVAAARNETLERVAIELDRLGEEPFAHPVRGMSPSEIRTLFEARSGRVPSDTEAARIIEATAGNPLFACELARESSERGRVSLEPPASVRTMLRERVRGLSDPARGLLEVAAVIGREVDVSLLSRVASRSVPDVLDLVEECVRAGLVEPPGADHDRFRFTHALTRETLYQLTSRAWRAQTHRTIGEAIEAMSPSRADAPADLLAHHFAEARSEESDRKAIDYALLASGRARSRLGYEDAARHLRRAIALFERQDGSHDEPLCEMLLELGELEELAGNRQAQLEAALRAAELARALRAPEQFARAALLRSEGGPQFGTVDDTTVALLEEGLELIGEADSPWRARLLRQLAEQIAFVAPHRRDRLDDEARAMAARLGDSRLQFDLGSEKRGMSQWLELADERLKLAEELGPAEKFDTLLNRGTVRLYLGDVAGMRADYARADAISAEVRGWRARYWPVLGRAALAILEGRFVEARELALAARAIGYPAYAESVANYDAQLYFIAYHRGRLRHVAAKVAAAERSYDPMQLAFLAHTHAAEHARRDSQRIFEIFADADFENVPNDPTFVSEHWEFGWPTTMSMLAEVCVYLADERNAVRLYERMHGFQDYHGVLGSYVACHAGPISLRLGMLAALLGEREAADAHLAATIEWAHEAEAPTWLAHALLQRALAASAAPETRARARAFAEQALQIGRQLLMEGVVREAHALL